MGLLSLRDLSLVLQRQRSALAVEPTDELALKAHRQRVVHELMHQDRAAGVVHPFWRRRQLQEEPLEDDGVVLLHDALMLGRDHELQIEASECAEGGATLPRMDGEAAVEVADEGASPPCRRSRTAAAACG